MSRFKSEIDLVKDGPDSYTLNYNIFTPGRRLSEVEANLTQVNEYNSGDQSIPGVKIELKFDEIGPGNPLTLSGSIPITTPYVLDETKPFIEVVYKAWDNATGKYESKGGTIVRGHVSE